MDTKEEIVAAIRQRANRARSLDAWYEKNEAADALDAMADGIEFPNGRPPIPASDYARVIKVTRSDIMK